MAVASILYSCLLLLFVESGAKQLSNATSLLGNSRPAESDISNIGHLQLFCQIGEEPNFCAPWSYCKNGKCTCGQIKDNILKCEKGGTSILDRHCLTYDEVGDVMEAGKCIYNVENSNDYQNTVYHMLPPNISAINDFMCGKFNRNGTLCGKCRDGYYPLAYSFDMDCTECPRGWANWWKYALAAFLPLTIFYFVVLILKINATSSFLYGFVFSGQAICIPALARNILLTAREWPVVLCIARIGYTFFGVWNLDFFRSMNLRICLGTGILPTLALDLVVGLYPLLLIFLSYFFIHLYDSNFKPFVVIWKPFRLLLGLFHRKWEVRTSVIDAFATFFLLSNVKFLSVSFDLLVPVKVHQINMKGEQTLSWRLYYDASIEYFGVVHLPYAILSIFVLVIFVILPVLVLILYPFHWFQKFLNLFPFRWYILHTFVDSFQGCYKDGTEPGTCDCRWFSSLFFTIRFLLFLIGALTMSILYFVIGSMLLAVFAMLILTVQPHKPKFKHYSIIDSIFVLLTATLYACLSGINIAEQKYPSATFIFYFIPSLITFASFLYIPAIIVYHIGPSRLREFMYKPVRRLQTWNRGYRELPGASYT